MKAINLSLCFLLFLLFQIDRQEASPVYLSSMEDTDDHPSWQYNDMDHPAADEDARSSPEQLWKRLVLDLPTYQRERRFGNTRYGRSAAK